MLLFFAFHRCCLQVLPAFWRLLPRLPEADTGRHAEGEKEKAETEIRSENQQKLGFPWIQRGIRRVALLRSHAQSRPTPTPTQNGAYYHNFHPQKRTEVICFSTLL